MAKMIQIRNVPEDLHRRVKARAALAGMSLSDYLLREIREAADRPTPDELLQRIQSRPSLELEVTAAEIIREHRGPV